MERKRFQLKSRTLAGITRSKGCQLFMLAFPFLMLIFIFSYLPLYGWVYSLFNYRLGIPLVENEFVGMQWFRSIVSNPIQAEEVLRVLRNTVAISSLGLLFSAVPALFAVFLTEIRSQAFKKSVQILTTLPNFISWVLVYSFAFALFATNSGWVNRILTGAGIVEKNINFLATDMNTWLTMCLWGLWKHLGWSAVIYLAAIAGIDAELYEASRADGAGRFRVMWHITVPGILPTYFVLLLLQAANFANNGLDQYFVFQNPINKAHIEVLDLYVYNIGIAGSNFSFAAAVSILKSIVSIVLLFGANRASRFVRGESII